MHSSQHLTKSSVFQIGKVIKTLNYITNKDDLLVTIRLCVYIYMSINVLSEFLTFTQKLKLNV